MSFIVVKHTALYYYSTELHHKLGHWSFRISISSSRIVLHCICFICFLCIVYEIETMASSSKSEVWKYFVREGTENKVKCSICDIEVDHKRGSTSAAKRHLNKKHNVEITTVKSDSVNVNVASAIDPKQPKLHQFVCSFQTTTLV